MAYDEKESLEKVSTIVLAEFQMNPDSADVSLNIQSPVKKDMLRIQIRRALSGAVVEPYLFLFMFSYSSRGIPLQTLIRDKVCLNDLGYNQVNCSNLHNFSTVEMEVQRLTNLVHTGDTLISMIPAVIIVILLGTWSDKYGRKIPILLGSAGQLLSLAGIIICVIYFDATSTMLLWTAVPDGMSGGIVVILTQVLSYISETSLPEDRAIRYAFFEIVFTLGPPAGTAFGGYMFDQFGFQAVFISSFVSLAISMMWIIFRMKEPHKAPLKDAARVIRDLCSISNVRENIRTCSKKREGNYRMQIWMLFLAMFIHIICFLGILNVSYLYLQRRFGWETLKMSIVSTVNSILLSIIIGISVSLLTKVWKVHDCILVVIGSLCGAIYLGITAFATQEFIYYIGSAIGYFSGLVNIGISSRVSKLVSKEELGKLFSVLALVESFTPVIGTAISGQLYNASVATFLGLTHLVFAILDLLPFFVAAWMLMKCPGIPVESSTLPELCDPNDNELVTRH